MNEQIDNEQWKSTGNCSICRRHNYCSKQCRANKAAMQATIEEVLNTIPSYNAMKKALKDVKSRMKEAPDEH